MRWRAAALAVAALLLIPAPSGRPPARPRRAVIYLQPGSVAHDRQMKACIEYCDERGYEWDTVTGLIEAAVAVVAARDADLVLTAFASRSRPEDLRTQAASAGVRVEYVRPPLPGRERGNVIAEMYRNSNGSDGDVKLIARFLGDTTDNILAIIRRLGIRR